MLKDAVFLNFYEAVDNEYNVIWVVDEIDRYTWIGAQKRHGCTQHYHEGNEAIVWARYTANVTGEQVSARRSLDYVIGWFENRYRKVDLSG